MAKFDLDLKYENEENSQVNIVFTHFGRLGLNGQFDNIKYCK